MIEVGSKARINVHWKVNPYDYSKEKQSTLVSKFSKKYDIPKDKVRVVPDFIMLDNNGDKVSIANDVIANIQKPEFQQQLFGEYLSVNEIKNYDFEQIKKIDAEINASMNYEVYETYKHYTIKWVKWSNFLSYGDENFFDFTTLKGLILLSGNPANQSGKSTFAIDLIHFLLFGKTDKAATQEKIFNKHMPEATEVVVEGCINIEGDDYVIKRTLKRPSLSKRSSRSKTVQKVEYYKIIGDIKQELEDYDVEAHQQENNVATNKIIKESIGNESDFDMIICATSSNLDNLIEKKEAERGKLLSRWIGLLPLEEKDIRARELYNSNVKPYLLSSRVNAETLKEEVNAYKVAIQGLKTNIIKGENQIKNIEEELTKLNDVRTTYISSKNKIDETLLKVDIVTLNQAIENLVNQGKQKNLELQEVENEIKKLGEVKYSANEYDDVNKLIIKHSTDIAKIRAEYSSIKNIIEALKKSEYCPTCGRKYENVDNSKKIEEHTKTLDELTIQGKNVNEELQKCQTRMEEIKKQREVYEMVSKLTVQKSLLETKIATLRMDYKEKTNIHKEYEKNNEAIDKNNKLDIQIRNLETQIKTNQISKETHLKAIEREKNDILNYERTMEEKNAMIKQIEEEEKLMRSWRIYLDMVGRNGISKMVLRKALPIINAKMSQLLSDVCDFNVEININDKNDIIFYLVKDGVYSDLTSGSGFEKTAAALALRIVLGNISTLPRLESLILDEVLARVSEDNLECMHNLLLKVLEEYKFIMLITHNTAIKDWCDTEIVVNKDSNISRLAITAKK